MNKMIILSVTTIAMLTLSGCGDKAKEEGTKSAVEVAKDAATKAVDATKEAATATAEKAKETAAAATDTVKETATKAVEATKEAATATVEKAKETATAATEAVKETATKAADATKEAAATATAAATGGSEKGKAVYAKCVSCHGADGKTKALGKSEIIAGQAAADLEKKLQEYKAGTRNVAGMGMLMKGQAGPLSDEDIKAVAEYISSLK